MDQTRSLSLYAKPRKRRTSLTPEASLQVTVMEYIRLTALDNVFALHIVNEGRRSKEGHIFMKRMGLLPGAADILIVIEGRAHFLELKQRGAKQTPEQLAFEAMCLDFCVPYAVADNIGDALSVLRGWHAIKPDAGMRRRAA